MNIGELRYRGAFAAYFNHHGAAPLVWCIAMPNEFELAVKTITFEGVDVVTQYERQERRADHLGPPSAWLTGRGEIVVLNGHAVITPTEQLSTAEKTRARGLVHAAVDVELERGDDHPNVGGEG